MKKIQTHEDLVAERERLERSIVIHKAMLTRELENVRTEVNVQLQPAMNVMQSAQQILRTLQSPIVIASAIGIALLATKKSKHQTHSLALLPVATKLLLTFFKRTDNRKLL